MAAVSQDPDRPNHMSFGSTPRLPVRQNWPYLAAPLGAYLLVMVPICALEAFLIATRCPTWMQVSAGLVLAVSLYELAQGYLRRLVLTRQSASLVGLFSRIEIRWADARRVDVYIPGGGVGSTAYLYITRRDEPPRGKWDCDEHTIQVQNRPGLREAVRHFASFERAG